MENEEKGTIEQAVKYLSEMGAIDAPNPTLYKAISMRRLMDKGVSYEKAHIAVFLASQAPK